MYYCYREGKFRLFSGDATHTRQRNLIQNGWYLHKYTRRHASGKNIYSMPQISSYRRLWARPGLRRAAIVPCPFIPLDLGRGVIPFETLQRSRRDPLGP
jgi:hypothetical protein